MALRYQLVAGRKYDRLWRVHENGNRDIMCFIERGTHTVFEAFTATKPGPLATPYNASLYLGLADLAEKS